MNKSQIISKNILANEISLRGILAILIILSHSTIGEKISLGQFSVSSINYFIVAAFFSFLVMD